VTQLLKEIAITIPIEIGIKQLQGVFISVSVTMVTRW